jgi:hypothetical protein
MRTRLDTHIFALAMNPVLGLVAGAKRDVKSAANQMPSVDVRYKRCKPWLLVCCLHICFRHHHEGNVDGDKDAFGNSFSYISAETVRLTKTPAN